LSSVSDQAPAGFSTAGQAFTQFRTETACF
jgi:hypothetical protein